MLMLFNSMLVVTISNQNKVAHLVAKKWMAYFLAVVRFLN